MASDRINVSLTVGTYNAIRYALGFSISQRLVAIANGKSYDAENFIAAKAEIEQFARLADDLSGSRPNVVAAE